MRIFILIALYSIAQPAISGIYKCIDRNGKTTYLDSECPNNSHNKIIIKPDEAWVKTLKANKNLGVTIKSVKAHEEKTLITYTYKNRDDSNIFIKHIHEISKLNVVLIKNKYQTKNKLYTSTVSVSNQQSKGLPWHKKLSHNK